MKFSVPAILRVRSLSFRLYVLILLALVLMLLVQLAIAYLEISRSNSRQVVSDLRMSAQAYADLTTLNMDDEPRREEFLQRLTDIRLGLSQPDLLPGEFRYVLCDHAGKVVAALPVHPPCRAVRHTARWSRSCSKACLGAPTPSTASTAS